MDSLERPVAWLFVAAMPCSMRVAKLHRRQLHHKRDAIVVCILACALQLSVSKSRLTHTQVSVRLLHRQHGDVAAQRLAAVHLHVREQEAEGGRAEECC